MPVSETSRRLTLGGSVHLLANSQSRANAALFERAVYATLEDRAPEEFSIDNVLSYVAYHTYLRRVNLGFRFCGYGVFMIIFPDRTRRRNFLHVHDKVVIDGCVVHFKAWKVSKGAEDVRYRKMSWLRILNLPEHHHNKESAAVIVSRFGKLVSVDDEKMEVDYSSLDVLVECEKGLDIPMQFPLVYDEVNKRQIVILIDLEMDIRDFELLIHGKSGLTYGQILKLAEDFVSEGCSISLGSLTI